MVDVAADPAPSPFAWHAALGPHLAPGRHGKDEGEAGVRLAEHTGFALVEAVARRGHGGSFAARLAAPIGLAAPVAGAASHSGGTALIWSGPERWRVLGDPGRIDAAHLAAVHGEAATFVDRRGGFGWISLSGPFAREVLARALPIDLDSRVFGTGDCALTIADHISVQLWQSASAPCYELLFPRSLAGSFLSWLMDHAAFAGVEIV